MVQNQRGCTPPEGAARPCAGRDHPALLNGRNNIMNEIITAISTVGFPIVFCLILFWYLREETNSHKEEVAELKSVIAENNSILASLKQLIEDKLNG